LEEKVITKGEEWHFRVGKELYGPLVAGYCQWLESNCGKLGYSGPVYFALRDAAPLQEAAGVMWQGKMIYPVGIYVNRPLLGIEDEIAPEAANVDGHMQKYLTAYGLMAKPEAVWADTGAWGTVIKVLKQKILVDTDLYPFFWFSHNPRIPGYINHLLTHIGMDPNLGEVLNDSLECVFPQIYKRPLELVSGNVGWEVKLEKSNLLAVAWGQAALAGVRSAAVEYAGGISQEQQLKALSKLITAHQEAKEGKCTGVLPDNTPTWSKGQDFLTDWPENLLP
jgi:hypothetical protein